MYNKVTSLVYGMINGKVKPYISEQVIGSPKEGEVKVAVCNSSINYRDYLAFNGNKGVVRRYPYVPGVDIVGQVVESFEADYPEGSVVALFAASPGECFPGGWSDICIVKVNRLVRIEPGWSAVRVAAVGTAGLAAASALDFALRNYAKDIYQNPVCAISGANGGVGTLACALAAANRCHVIAVVRDPSAEYIERFHRLGVNSVVSLDSILAGTEMNLARETFDVAIDTLGGKVTSALAKKLKSCGAMGVCGIVTSQELQSLNLVPFLLRGISIGGSGAEVLVGTRRERSLKLMSVLYSSEILEDLYSTIPLVEVPRFIKEYNNKKSFGRIVIAIGG